MAHNYVREVPHVTYKLLIWPWYILEVSNFYFKPGSESWTCCFNVSYFQTRVALPVIVANVTLYNSSPLILQTPFKCCLNKLHHHTFPQWATFHSIACENIHFFSLLTTGEVSWGERSTIQQQKFHTDDVKSAQNPVISTDWTME